MLKLGTCNFIFKITKGIFFYLYFRNSLWSGSRLYVDFFFAFDMQLYNSKGPFDSLNIYCPYGSRISGFKNIKGNRPLLRYENFYMAQNIWCHNIWKNQIINKSPQRDLNSMPTLHLSDTLLLYYGSIYHAFFFALFLYGSYFPFSRVNPHFLDLKS